MSAERFQRLGRRVSVVIFHGVEYNYGKNINGWKVQVKFTDDDTKIEVEEINAFLDLALERAYDRLDKIVSVGLGASAMLPAIEHQPKTVNEETSF